MTANTWKRAYVPANTQGSAAVVVVAYLFAAISTILIVLRFIARKVKKIDYGIDDWLALAAWPVILGHLAIILASVYLGGIGHRQSTLQPENSVALFKTLTALQFSFGVSLGLVKASIITLLMRIFDVPRFRFLAKLVLVYVVCWSLMCMLIGAAMCRPFAKNWDPTIPGKCGNALAAYIAIAATDIVGDLMIVALPMSNIWKLQTDLKTKLALTVIFAIGLLDVIVGILRIIYLEKLTKTADYTESAVNCWVWSTMEPSLALSVACLPTLKPLFSKREEKTTVSTKNLSRANTVRSSNDDISSRDSDMVALREPYHEWSRSEAYGGPKSKTWVTVGNSKDHKPENAVPASTKNPSPESVPDVSRAGASGPDSDEGKSTGQSGIRIDRDVTISYHGV